MSSKTEMTPEVNSSFNASTSVVTRVIRRPTGFLSKKETSSFCKMPENLHAQIVHDLLAHHVNEPRLAEAQCKNKISVNMYRIAI